jgi:putative PIN family toxin of toxin-antitoxin system
VPTRITADTNIYISALNFGGVPERVLTLARAGQLDLAISDAILSEIARVLTVKFRWAPEPLNNALREIAAYSRRIEPQQKLQVITHDPTDNRILECAISAGSDYIVSGYTRR